MRCQPQPTLSQSSTQSPLKWTVLASEFVGQIPIGTIITADFVIDDAAQQLSFSQQDVMLDDGSYQWGVQNTTTWEASSAYVSATIAGTTITASGSDTVLKIQDTPLYGYSDDQWILADMSGPAVDLFDVQIDTVSIIMLKMFGGAISSADLQVPVDVTAWQYGYGGNTRMTFSSSTSDAGVGGNLLSITRVPEPSTLALFGVGALLLLRHQRKQG